MAISIQNAAEIQNALRSFNSWWQGVQPAIKTKFQRHVFASVWQTVSQDNLNRAVLLVGPRRVGKTTLLLQLVEKLLAAGVSATQIMYVSLDHPLLRNVTLEAIVKAYAEAAESDPAQTVYLLLDEIHYAKDWSTWLKLFVDFRRNLRIVATGSASFAVQTQGNESAAGRFVTLRMPPLLFPEYLALREVEPPARAAIPTLDEFFAMPERDRANFAARCEPLQAHVQRYLLVGGFPEAAAIAEMEKAQRLLREDVLDAVIKRDLVSFFSLRTVTDAENLFLYICLKSGGIVSVQELCSAMELTKVTVNNLLAVLEQAGLIFRLAPLDLSGKKHLKARYKYYTADASLRCSVLLRSSSIFSDARETGIVAETAAMAHLMAAFHHRASVIGYWRDATTQKEVDAVVQFPGELLPLEIKYRDAAKIEKNSGLLAFAQNPAVRRAVLVTKSSQDFSAQNLPAPHAVAALKIPLFLFLYILGNAPAN